MPRIYPTDRFGRFEETERFLQDFSKQPVSTESLEHTKKVREAQAQADAEALKKLNAGHFRKVPLARIKDEQ